MNHFWEILGNGKIPKFIFSLDSFYVMINALSNLLLIKLVTVNEHNKTVNYVTLTLYRPAAHKMLSDES